MEQVIGYLDISPLIRSLATRPQDFEMQGPWLRHAPSCHRFKVDRQGTVRIDAACDCALLNVRREQGRELWATFEKWYELHWRIVEINKEFASHFSKPNAWLSFRRRLFRRGRRALVGHSGSELSRARQQQIGAWG